MKTFKEILISLTEGGADAFWPTPPSNMPDLSKKFLSIGFRKSMRVGDFLFIRDARYPFQPNSIIKDAKQVATMTYEPKRAMFRVRRGDEDGYIGLEIEHEDIGFIAKWLSKKVK